MADNRMSRRNLLIGAGAVALATAVGGWAYCGLRERNPFDRAYHELSDFLDKNDFGKIGRTYRGNEDSVVLAVRQVHEATPEIERKTFSIIKKVTEYKKELEKTLQETDDPMLKDMAVQNINRTNEILNDAHSKLKVTSDSQKQIYLVLNNLSNRMGTLILGAEGLFAGTEYPLCIPETFFDNNGLPIVENQFSFFYQFDACGILNKKAQRNVIVGLEDKIIFDEALQLLEEELKNKNRESSRFNELQILRGKVAVDSLRSEMLSRSRKVGVLVYGADHFTKYSPDITEILESKKQSYIEFIPKAVDEMKK